MPLPDLKRSEVWFVTGSQHLYGPETLEKVAEHAAKIATALDAAMDIPVQVQFKPVVTTPEAIFRLCMDVNNSASCIGIIAWMHTFSPAKMWINGLKVLHKPMLHLHTQFNREIPWGTIDMDFMNLNQSAHGDREFGHIATRLGLARKVVVGHWQDRAIQLQVGTWCRAAAGWDDMKRAKYVRFGDNMRQVAVTEGDKVEAQIRFGFSVNTHGIGDLSATIRQVKEKELDSLVAIYEKSYSMAPALKKKGALHVALREAARIEAGLRQFLEAGGYQGFTDTFEDLHGLRQLPGIAVQRLMEEGYGFGAEGDWKTAALLRAMKVMAAGLAGGNSFMEDYTYHLEPRNHLVLGAHMLEICPSIASGKPSCEIHPLGIGGKEDPVRLVFNTAAGPALNASLVDLGHRFRLLVNEVEGVKPVKALPKLPVARVLWKPLPDFHTACASWILAGGAHHTVFSQNLGMEHLFDFSEMAGLELVHIGRHTTLHGIRNELRWNEVAYR
jgi:L-arabinose isomerase